MTRRLPRNRWVWMAWASALATMMAASAESESVREGLRWSSEHLVASSDLLIGDERILAVAVLPQFYERRAFDPAWSTSPRETEKAQQLVRSLLGAVGHGLIPQHYHLEVIRRILAELPVAPQSTAERLRIELDLLCTDAFLIYAAHLVSGRVDPESIDPEWTAVRREVDVGIALDEALRQDAIHAVLQRLLPDHEGYRRLCDALRRYREIASAGGWEMVEQGPKLDAGMRDPRVRQLRMRLQREVGPVDDEISQDADLFDDGLMAAVRRFQGLHGLERDGIVGPATLAALNVSAAGRVRQIVLNLERWRWLPQDLGERFVLVNIPAFEATVTDTQQEVFHTRVIVGRAARRTPVFSGHMTYLVINPSWEVPPRLAAEDLLPAIRKDPAYVLREGFQVLSGWEGGAIEVDPTTIDWDELEADRFAYRLRQRPGPRNALGRVKFMFPNKHNVYLHDTPGTGLFARSERSISSGCIRVEKALDLAECLLRPRWTRSQLDSLLALGRPVTVTLPRAFDVHLLYWTAW